MIKSRGKSKRKVVSQIAVAEQTVENIENSVISSARSLMKQIY